MASADSGLRTDPLLQATQERVLAWMRTLGALVGVPIALTFAPPWPGGPKAVPVAVIVAVGLIGLAGLIARPSPATVGTMRAYTMAADAGFLLTFSLVHAHQDYSIAHALLFVLPIEGAIKYGRRGAIFFGSLVILETIPRQALRLFVFDLPFNIEQAAFMIVPAALVGSAATILEWTARREAVRATALAEAEARARRELESLNHVVMSGVGELGSGSLRGLAEDVATTMGIPALAIVLVDDAGRIEPVSVHGGDAGRLPAAMDPDRALSHAIRTRESQLVFERELRGGSTLLPSARCVAIVPLQGTTGTIGALVAESDTEDGIDRITLGPLERVARQVALLLEAQRAYETQADVADHFRRLDQLKEDFLSIASHEIRTPLTSLLGTTETLHERGDELSPDARRQMVAGMHRNTRRLIRLLRDLELARAIDRGDIALALERIDLEEELTRYRARPYARGVGFVGPRGIATVADADRIVDVLDRLLENAHRHAGGAAITVSWGADATPWIRIADLGPGIASSLHEAVFQRYTTVADVLAHQRGAGLGLPLARDICRAMGGDLVLEDTEVGTSLLIRLPRATEAVPPSPFSRRRLPSASTPLHDVS